MVNWLSNYVIENKPKNLTSPLNLERGNIRTASCFFPNEFQPTQPESKQDFLPANSQELLFKKVDEIDFNCFEYYTNSDKNGLVYLMYHLFQKASLFDKLKINSTFFINFITKIQKG